MSPDTCPKFDSCSAPICPLDPDWNKRVMHRDERVCRYIFKSEDEFESDDVIVQRARELIASADAPASLARALEKRSKRASS